VIGEEYEKILDKALARKIRDLFFVLVLGIEHDEVGALKRYRQSLAKAFKAREMAATVISGWPLPDTISWAIFEEEDDAVHLERRSSGVG
jgi:hypothetical protein